MTVKVLIEALLIDWVKRNMYRGERKSADGARIRGRVSRDANTARWHWWVERWGNEVWLSGLEFQGWITAAHGDTLTRLGAKARVHVALRAYEHGTELIR